MSNLRQAAQQALEALESDHPDIQLRAAIALRAALAEPDHFVGVNKLVEPVAWVPVTEALPKSGVKVLACYRNRLGNLRRIRAQWIAAKTQGTDGEDSEACSEYDEATDTFYTTEGWYECIDNWGDYSSVAVTEGDVTHWMPLPPDPDTAPTPLRPLTDEVVKTIWDSGMKYAPAEMRVLAFARAIEKAHGIGEQT